MRSCWRGGFLETLLWFPTGGAAIGRAVENVLPVVIGLPLSIIAAEAFGDLLASFCDLLCTSNGMG